MELSSPKAFLNQVFLDLSNFRGGLPQHHKVQLAYDQLEKSKTVASHVQFNLPESFRKLLIYELRAPQYDVSSPSMLEPELRSDRWQLLCDYLDTFNDHSVDIQIKIVRLLGGLCFHNVIVEKVSPLSDMNLSDNTSLSTLAFLRAFSKLLINNDQSLPAESEEIKFIAYNSPEGSLAKVAAALQLLVVSAYSFRDLEGAEYWRSYADAQVKLALPSLDSFTAGLLLSNYYRAASFVPQLRNDAAQLIHEMDQCQAHAESLAGFTTEQKYLCRENLNIILESRAKEALWLKDLELAEARTRHLVTSEVNEPRYQLELGEILLKKGQYSDSAKCYRKAARLGPPDTAIAWFMAGQCYQSLGDQEAAYQCYASSIDSDPYAISPVKRICQLANSLEPDYFVQWAAIRLAQLEKKKKKMEAEGSEFSKPREINKH